MRKRPPENSFVKPSFQATIAKRETSRRLRREATPAERTLREALRARQLCGIKFRFMHPLAGFVLDFYAPAIGLCVEVDGPIHDSQHEYDDERTRALCSLGIAVLRLTNDEVLTTLPDALERVASAIRARPLNWRPR